jgi:hypothetical protein
MPQHWKALSRRRSPLIYTSSILHNTVDDCSNSCSHFSSLCVVTTEYCYNIFVENHLFFHTQKMIAKLSYHIYFEGFLFLRDIFWILYIFSDTCPLCIVYYWTRASELWPTNKKDSLSSRLSLKTDWCWFPWRLGTTLLLLAAIHPSHIDIAAESNVTNAFFFLDNDGIFKGLLFCQ